MVREKMSVSQFTLITIHFTIGTTILIGSSVVTGMSRQDGWMASILGLLLNLIMIAVYNMAGSRLGGRTVPEYIDWLLGKFAGRLLLLLFFGYVFLLSALLLRVVGAFIVTYIMTETPIEVVQLLFAVVTVAAVRKGIENIARTSELFMPAVLVFILSMLVLLLPKMELNNLLPMLDTSPFTLSVASFYYFSLQEQVILLFLFPYVNHIGKAGKSLIVGTAIGGLILVLVTLMSIVVLGPGVAGSMIYPSYILAKTINVGDFLQRIEAIMAILWLITIFIKLTICLYVCCNIISHTFGMRDMKPLTIPLGMIAVTLSIFVYDSAAQFLEFTPKTWSVFAAIFTVVLPVLLFIAALFRMPKERKSA